MRVLGVWITLVEAQLVPPMQFVALTGAAIHRLEDVTSSTQKAALTLLSVLLKHNPFSGDLGSWRFRKHLEVIDNYRFFASSAILIGFGNYLSWYWKGGKNFCSQLSLTNFVMVYQEVQRHGLPTSDLSESAAQGMV